MKGWSSHRSNFRPTSGIRATTVKPSRSWNEIDSVLAPSIAATITWTPSARA